ncbi:MAG: helix-turn-helix domain-containing protein [Rhodospirillales bacterium]|jgi:hypothetical protein
MVDFYPNHPSAAYAAKPARKGAVPGPGRSYDWALVVAMLSRGHKVNEVARFTGISRSQIWRILRRSNVARGMLHEVRVRRAVETATRLELARSAAVELILNEVKDGNLRAALWVADRLSVTSWGYPTQKLTPADMAEVAVAEAAIPDPDRSYHLDADGNSAPPPKGEETPLELGDIDE